VEAERRILEMVRDHPGLTSRELMRLVDAKRGSTLDRLQRLRVRGAIERDGRGWRLREERPIAGANEEEPEAEDARAHETCVRSVAMGSAHRLFRTGVDKHVRLREVRLSRV
jgi:DNA-binding Lrp family transcriptional regulator